MKTRNKTKELIIYDYLVNRKSLSSEETTKYESLTKGYTGEIAFDKQIEQLKQNHLILRDLWLFHNKKAFQMDIAIIMDHIFHVYEVKNYVGEYYYENDKLYTLSGKQIDDPLLQLKRTESLLTQLLRQLGYHIPICTHLVFINPECTIFQAPRNKGIILPTQLNRYFHSFQSTKSLDSTQYHLAEKLESIRLQQSPYAQTPEYQYDKLKKGTPCPQCGNFYTNVKGKMCICDTCGTRESVTIAILRNVKEFMILFPNERITTAKIIEWCCLPVAKHRFKYCLQKYLYTNGKNKGAYYLSFKDN